MHDGMRTAEDARGEGLRRDGEVSGPGLEEEEPVWLKGRMDVWNTLEEGVAVEEHWGDRWLEHLPEHDRRRWKQDFPRGRLMVHRAVEGRFCQVNLESGKVRLVTTVYAPGVQEMVIPTPLLRSYRPPAPQPTVPDEPDEPWAWPALPSLALPPLPPPPPFQSVAETLGFPVNPFTPTEMVRSHRSFEEQVRLCPRSSLCSSPTTVNLSSGPANGRWTRCIMDCHTHPREVAICFLRFPVANERRERAGRGGRGNIGAERVSPVLEKCSGSSRCVLPFHLHWQTS